MTTRRAMLGALFAPLKAIAPSMGTEDGPRERPDATGTASRLEARLEPDLCVAHGGGDCRLCLASCVIPGALVDRDGAPLIDDEKCDGCGACALACATATSPPAIRVVPVAIPTNPKSSFVEAAT